MIEKYYTKEEIMEFHNDAEREQSWGDIIFHYEGGRVSLVRLELVKKKDSSKQRTTRGTGSSHVLDKQVS